MNLFDNFIEKALYIQYYIKLNLVNIITKFIFNNSFITKIAVNLLYNLSLISPNLLKYLLSLSDISNKIILPYNNKLQNLNKNNIYKLNKNYKTINNRCIIHLHGGAGILQFPTIYTNTLFKDYKSKFDLYYLSYDLVYNVSNIVTIITSCSSNIYNFINENNYDEYIFIADSMGAPILYYTILFLYYKSPTIQNLSDSGKIKMHFISPFVFYKDIKPNKYNDYISYKGLVQLDNVYQNMIPYFNSIIYKKLQLDDIIEEKFIKIFNIKVYYSDTEMLGTYIQKFCETYNLENYVFTNYQHCEFFYTQKIKYNIEDNVFELKK